MFRSNILPLDRAFCAVLGVVILVLGLGGSAWANTDNAATSKAPVTATTPTNKSTAEKPAKATTKAIKPTAGMKQYLDRLMIAESGGNDLAKNPLSTATGAYQFIESTFLQVMRRHFPKRVENLDRSQILELRKNRAIARAAALAYSRDNATRLVAAGHKSSYPHLRLAYLLGAGGAIKVLAAKPATPLAKLMSPAVIRANPWMSRLTAGGLIRRSARDVSLSPKTTAGLKPRRDPVTGKLVLPKSAPRKPRIRVRCNLARPSCRRWLALKKKQLARKARSRKTSKRVAQNKR